MPASPPGVGARVRLVLLLWVIGLAVRWLPFRWVAPRVLGVRRRATGVAPAVLADRVQRASRRCRPAAGCLAEALVLARLLLAHGHDARVVVGVSRVGGFAAHAWVEHEGAAIGEGAVAMARFAALERFGPRGAEGRI